MHYILTKLSFTRTSLSTSSYNNHLEQKSVGKYNKNMNIQSSSPTGQRSPLDYSIVVCSTLVLLLFILLLDAYEYVTVPGARHAQKQLHEGVESLTGMEIMTKKEIAELKKQLEEAKSVVHDKKVEVEEIVHKVEKMEHEIKPESAPVTKEEKEEEKEKEEEIVEKAVEKELGLDKWCGSCKWRQTPWPCDQRVSFLIGKYHVGKVEAKEALLLNKECHTRRNLRGMWDDSYKAASTFF